MLLDGFSAKRKKTRYANILIYDTFLHTFFCGAGVVITCRTFLCSELLLCRKIVIFAKISKG